MNKIKRIIVFSVFFGAIIMIAFNFMFLAKAEDIADSPTVQDNIEDAVLPPVLDDSQIKDLETTQEDSEAPEKNIWKLLYARLCEAYDSGELTTVLNIFYSIASVIILLIVKSSGAKGNKDVKKAFADASDLTNGKVNELVSASNATTQSVEVFKQELSNGVSVITEACEKTRLDDQKMISDLYAATLANADAIKALSTMVSTVYSGSTTIPQPIKDIVNVNYATVLKELEAVSELRKNKNGLE